MHEWNNIKLWFVTQIPGKLKIKVAKKNNDKHDIKYEAKHSGQQQKSGLKSTANSKRRGQKKYCTAVRQRKVSNTQISLCRNVFILFCRFFSLHNNHCSNSPYSDSIGWWPLLLNALASDVCFHSVHLAHRTVNTFSVRII